MKRIIQELDTILAKPNQCAPSNPISRGRQTCYRFEKTWMHQEKLQDGTSGIHRGRKERHTRLSGGTVARSDTLEVTVGQRAAVVVQLPGISVSGSQEK